LELHGNDGRVGVILTHIIDKCSIKWLKDKNIEMYCDNKAVITSISSRLGLRRTMNQHRYLDVDIEQQLVKELLELRKKKTPLKIQHVKGHQDTNTSFHRELKYKEI
jgi:ribonuclease HI